MRVSNDHGDSEPSETVAVPPLLPVIRSHPFFQELPLRHLHLLAANGLVMSFEPGQSIFREGDPANRFYLITAGTVALESHLRGEPSIRIQTLGSGDVLGWSWLFPPYYWHFDARVLKPTTTVYFYGSRLREYCESDHDLGYELMKKTTQMLIHRLQETRRLLLQSQPVDG
jgi:CRP-like cAMP-binding protein